MARQDRSYIGKGTIYIQPRDGLTAMLPIGNCSKLELSFDEEKKAQKDYTSAGGGNANVLVSISSISASLITHDISSENLALGLRGSISYQTASAVVDETHDVLGVDGEMIPFDFVPDTATAYVITDSAGTTTYVDGTDYAETPNGILVIGAGAIGAETIKVDYTKAVSEVMQALTEAGLEYRLFFDGLNEAQSGKAVAVRIHRAKFSPAQGLGLIGDDFAEMPLDLEILSDTAIVGAGLSKFLSVTQVV